MCDQNVLDTPRKANINWRIFAYYSIAIILAVLTAMSKIEALHLFAKLIADVFINMFRCLSLPVIFTSIVVTFAKYKSEESMAKIWKSTLSYTLSTTIMAAIVACILYVVISPATISNGDSISSTLTQVENTHSYFSYIINLIPTSFITPFIEQQVISVLLLGIVIGFAIRQVKNVDARNVVTGFFTGIHEILLTITGWLVKIVPIAIYGFIAVTIIELKNGVELGGLWSYLSIIVLANLIQGFIVLPLLLVFNGIRPFSTMRGMLPALSLAFFTKSSSGTLPVTIDIAEKNVGIDPKISRFVLPLCTTINMNGCAAFIFVTVMYLMQNHGINIDPLTMVMWIFIATLAAVGNAGVPMGCFFLSASLLSGMNIPITILGLILPVYSLIDMLETALNVWSDACITTVIDHKEKTRHLESMPVAIGN